MTQKIDKSKMQTISEDEYNELGDDIDPDTFYFIYEDYEEE